MADDTAEPAISPVAANRAALLAILHAALWAPFFYFLFFAIPAAKRTFEDFGMKLPPLTAQFIALSDWARSVWFLAVLLVAPLLLLDVIAMYALGRRRRGLAFWLWFTLLLLLPTAAAALAWLAVQMPLAELMEGLSR